MKQTIIYNRVSTTEQNPTNQLKDCVAVAKRLNLNEYEVLQESKSGYKEIEREVFNSIRKAIQQRQVKNLICWDLDRLFRNRKKLMQFFEFCKIYNCKIYSFRQEWLEGINNIQPPFNEIVHSLMLQLMGWLSEDESKKKSDRVKASVRKKNGVTYTYKGNKWGRKAISKRVIKEVLELRKQGLTIRQISSKVYYWDSQRNKKQLSKSAVHKILSELNKETS